jgi:hypothetical protein
MHDATLCFAGALFYSMYSNTSSSITAGSRSSSITKASDLKFWQAKILQSQQLMLQQQQQQQQQQHLGSTAATASAGASVLPNCDSISISRQSSCIPAVHNTQQGLAYGRAVGGQQQQQQQRGSIYQQLTVCAAAADIEAPTAQDQQQQLALHMQSMQWMQSASPSPSPLQAYPRTASATSAALAAAAAAAATAGGVPPLLLPAVTLMFVSVDGAKVLRKHHVRDVHCQLSLLFMEALRRVPGGYMCRMQVRAGVVALLACCMLLVI